MKKISTFILVLILTNSFLLENVCAQDSIQIQSKNNLKSSLNAYSFNEPLSKGDMDVFELMHYCANLGFDAVDITAYYFDGYPNVPSDDYLYKVKQQAFLLGLDISGTGIRTNFTSTDIAVRNKSLALVKSWVIASKKMGIPIIRIFAGEALPKDKTREEVNEYLIASIKECVVFAKEHGVIIGLQNHWDYLQTSDQIIEVMQAVNSDWFGLILDVGSFKSEDPYKQIEACIPYAVSWQIKENVYVDGIETKTDLQKIANLIYDSKYQGYIPIETLGKGDPKIKVNNFFNQVKLTFK